ncbi:MAG: hypothetical protein LBH98_05725 [Chitinispirillales bacterium]|jgi:hypothetical protein|nr:hypothetical protein [Chitinispirillales bacterium]
MNILIAMAAMFFAACVGPEIPQDTVPTVKGGVKFAGIRSSYYGFADSTGKWETSNFPTPEEAATVMKNISKKFDDAVPSAVWIVGGIHGKECRLEFEQTQTNDPYIKFANQDKHTPYLNKFDEIGAKVYLQIEAGRANMKELIRLVLDKYSHHPSVAGFGIDVEWYPSDGDTNGPDEEVDEKLNTNDLIEFEALVKSYNPDYKIFVKHYNAAYVGGKPVGDVVYINDSYGFSGVNAFASEFANWANMFYPNEVGFQIGYAGDGNTDYAWWSKLENPMEEMVKAINKKMKNKDQVINVYWVDFTIRWKEFDELWKK